MIIKKYINWDKTSAKIWAEKEYEGNVFRIEWETRLVDFVIGVLLNNNEVIKQEDNRSDKDQ